MKDKYSFALRHSKCETPDLLQKQTRTITAAVAAHQKFINMKTGYSTPLSLRLRRIELFPLISLQEQRRAPLQWTLQKPFRPWIFHAATRIEQQRAPCFRDVTLALRGGREKGVQSVVS
jgi:hypothetical protein